MSIKMLIARARQRRKLSSDSRGSRERRPRNVTRIRQRRSKTSQSGENVGGQHTSARLKRVAEVIRQEFWTPQTYRHQVQALLGPLLPDNLATADHIADQLGISRQTLYRRLHQEGTNFKELLSDERERLANHYLSVKRMSVKETAWRLGFSSPEAFSRAFKRWTGVSPGKFQSSNSKSPAR